MMKSGLTLLTTLFMVVTMMAQDATVPASFNSLLKFDQPQQDLGVVKKGEKRTGTFTFKNVSKEEVTIELISVCDCTEVDYPMHAMAPGEEAQIDYTFDSSEKDSSEVIELEILLTNVEPKTGYQIVEKVEYTFQIVKE